MSYGSWIGGGPLDSHSLVAGYGGFVAPAVDYGCINGACSGTFDGAAPAAGCGCAGQSHGAPPAEIQGGVHDEVVNEGNSGAVQNEQYSPVDEGPIDEGPFYQQGVDTIDVDPGHTDAAGGAPSGSDGQ